MQAVFELDKQHVRRSFATAAQSYDGMAALQRQVGLQLLQQYPLQNKWGNLLDLGCGTGFISQQLLKTVPADVQLFGLDIALTMCRAANHKNQLHDNLTLLCADAEKLPFKNNCFDAVYSSLALQWCLSLNSLFADIQQIVKPGGRFVMSTFGPATLQELKQSWKKVDTATHINDFYSIAQLKLLLEQAGFIDISLRSQNLVSYYVDVFALMKELKALGAHNASADRNRQLTGKSRLLKMLDAYEEFRVGAMIPATYEVFYISAIVS